MLQKLPETLMLHWETILEMNLLFDVGIQSSKSVLRNFTNENWGSLETLVHNEILRGIVEKAQAIQ